MFNWLPADYGQQIASRLRTGSLHRFNKNNCMRLPQTVKLLLHSTKMTIDRGFLQIWKSLAPGAFTPNTPFTPHSAFIDGQLHLMRPSGITCWTQLLHCQFVVPINRLFAMGATVVVLAFDNYKLTPTAKQPTQRKRTKRVPTVPWNADAQLPPTIPDNYEHVLMNRVFKARVCQFVVANIAHAVQLGNGRRLVIDYDNLPLEFTAEEDEPRPRSGFTMLGESDVKFCAHLQPGKRMVIDSVDGDYVCIALLQIENALRAGTQPPQIAIRRLVITQPRARGSLAARSSGRQYEFVHINRLLESLQRHILQPKLSMFSVAASKSVANNLSEVASPPTCASPQLIEMRIVAWLVSLVGCDFTEGLGGVGPKTVWEKLHVLWPHLLDTFQEACNEMDVSCAADNIVLPLLKSQSQFSNHVKHGPAGRLRDFLATVSSSTRLTERQREKLPSTMSIACLVRNCNWTLKYWCNAATAPDAVQKQFGFVRTATGNVQRDSHALLY